MTGKVREAHESLADDFCVEKLELQYPDTDSTAMLLCSGTSQLGADFDLQSVRSPESGILIANSDIDYSGWPVWKASALATGIGAVFGGTELLLVLTLRVRLLLHPVLRRPLSDTDIGTGPIQARHRMAYAPRWYHLRSPSCWRLDSAVF